MSQLRVGILIVICIEIFSFSPLFSERLYAQEGETPDALELLHETIALVQTYYIDEIPKSVLMDAVMRGIKNENPKEVFRQSAGVARDNAKTLVAEASQLAEVLSSVQRTTDLSSYNLIYTGIQRMLNALDPVSHIYCVQRNVEWLGPWPTWGIGIGLYVKDVHPAIKTVFPNSPASQAGLRPDDIITQINGKPTEYMGIAETALSITGTKGTALTVTIMREGWENSQEMTILRTFHLEEFHAYVINSHIGYLRIHQFHEACPQKVEDALQFFQEHHVSSVIVDIRENWGGHLEAVLTIVERFLHNGDLIATTQSRVESLAYRFVAQTVEPSLDYPVILLVNTHTAGVAEVFAGALQAHGRGLVIGAVTKGDTAVSSIIPIDQSHTLRLLSAVYVTPANQVLMGQGILPDILVTSQQTTLPDRHDAPVIIRKDATKDNILSVTLEIINNAPSKSLESFRTVAQEMHENTFRGQRN